MTYGYKGINLNEWKYCFDSYWYNNDGNSNNPSMAYNIYKTRNT